MEKINVYQIVTDRIIEQMNNGIIPWLKPWNGGDEDVAISYTTRKPYSMLNQWLLGESGEWLTFGQIKKLGGSVKKGEKSRFVVYFEMVKVTKQNEQGEDEIKTYPLLKYYNVFHLNQTEGIESKIKPEEIKQVPEMDATAEAVIAAYLQRENLKFQNDRRSNSAYYSPATDSVVVPMAEQFTDIAEYYSTAFHELVHSTMKEGRCDRTAENKGSFFGNAEYSREELVAEMGSAMLCSATNVETKKSFRNTVAYLQSWVKALKNDPKMIVWAASRAEKAAKYILG